MTDSNVVSIIGRLTGDCEISKGTNGTTYGLFSIAVNRSFLAGGDWHDETSFFDCCMFGDICSVKGPYLHRLVLQALKLQELQMQQLLQLLLLQYHLKLSLQKVSRKILYQETFLSRLI